MKKTLEQLEDEYNSHPRESNRLVLLCDNDLVKLEFVYKKLNSNILLKVPSTKEEVNQYLTT
jgi:hypothetical protein